METNKCPICDGIAQLNEKSGYEGYDITCFVCGKYSVTKEDFEDNILQKYPARYILSGISRNRAVKSRPIQFSEEKIESIVLSTKVPKTVLDKIEHILLYINENTTFGGQEIILHLNQDYPIGFCKNPEELNFLLNQLAEMGYIVTRNVTTVVRPDGLVKYERTTLQTYQNGCQLTFNGFKRIEELTATRPKGDQCFIAMSFADELNEVYDNGIYKAVNEANYKVFRVDKEQHNEKIDDKIISEIRRSSLMVADVTMHRQGVYFEAGFAMGLGIPVIWTCHTSDIKQAHFDTRQYNHIVWEKPEDLAEQLLNRINALYPRE